MTKQRFVDALAEVALDQPLKGELGVLLNPPGRRPSLDLQARSEWFRELADEDREMVVDVMRQAGYAVLHAVLCVLDGVAAIENGPDKGSLALVYKRNGSVIDLTNHESDSDLHDLLAPHR